MRVLLPWKWMAPRPRVPSAIERLDASPGALRRGRGDVVRQHDAIDPEITLDRVGLLNERRLVVTDENLLDVGERVRERPGGANRAPPARGAVQRHDELAPAVKRRREADVVALEVPSRADQEVDLERRVGADVVEPEVDLVDARRGPVAQVLGAVGPRSEICQGRDRNLEEASRATEAAGERIRE